MKKIYNLENYLVSRIDFDGYDIGDFETKNDVILLTTKNLYKRFLKEQNRKDPTVENIKQRLLGLAVSVDYTYFDIANRLEECGYKKTQDQKYQDQYYRGNIARMIYKAGQ